MNAKTFTGLTLEEAIVRLDEQLPPSAYKPVPGGADLTDIDPNYMRLVLNEVFGMCGYGWGYEYDPDTIRSRTDIRTNKNGKEYTVIIVTLSFLKFWYKLVTDEGVVTCEIPATGSSENSNDAYALKGALTNAIGNAVSNIGFQQSVYLGQRDHRTVKKTGKKAAYPTSAPSKKSAPKKAKAAPKSKASPSKAAPSDNGDPGSYIAPFGAGMKDKPLRDIPVDKLQWAAFKMDPFNDEGREFQAKAKAYLEQLEAVGA